MHILPFCDNSSRIRNSFDWIHCDVWEHYCKSSHDGNKIFFNYCGWLQYMYMDIYDEV